MRFAQDSKEVCCILAVGHTGESLEYSRWSERVEYSKCSKRVEESREE